MRDNVYSSHINTLQLCSCLY